MFELYLSPCDRNSHYKQWLIMKNKTILAVVLADPDDGAAFQVNFIEDTPTGCKNILDFIQEAEKAGGFKL